MIRPLFENLVPIAQRIVAASHLLVGLDYDGTLAPMVDDPSNATLNADVRGLLRKLAARPATSIAIVSGRRLVEVRELVAIDNLIYAGNHGLEIAGPSFSFVEENAHQARSQLTVLSRTLEKGLACIPGVAVEFKGLSIAVHFRRVAEWQKQDVARHVQAAVAVLPNRFRVCLGHQVFDIRPNVGWHKGTALGWIADSLGKPSALTMFIGDDTTDEDAFAMIAGGISVRVGTSMQSSAEFHVEDPAAATQFLSWLTTLKTNQCQESGA